MDCILQRTDYRSDGVFGMLTDRDGEFLAVTLEHAFGDFSYLLRPKIPAGDYTCRRRLSPKFGYDVFEVLDVPGATFIEIHIGNYNEDSDGCILLGKVHSVGIDNKWMLSYSKSTFCSFMESQQDVDEFQLTIIDLLQEGIK